MKKWIIDLDRILRGEATRPDNLRSGTFDLPIGGLAAVVAVLGAITGFCMGWFALFNRPEPEYRQLAACMIKVPALFGLTLLVTFPSLYVFNALVGSRLSLLSMLRLLLAALCVNLAIVASFGPIIAFFSLTTTSYPFMVLLNVVAFAVAGGLGLKFLLQTLHRLNLINIEKELAASDMKREADAGAIPELPPPAIAEGSDAAPPENTGAVPVSPLRLPGPLDMVGSLFGPNVITVFRCWVIVFGLVGAQMSWVLRPFIGAPNLPFEWWRTRQSNFFQGVWNAIQSLFG